MMAASLPAGAPQAERRAFGFTLVELLVVIAILSVLAVLAASAIGRVKAAADRTACASNMRQIGIALTRFANDHAGNYPETTHGHSHQKSWIFTLAPYLENIDKIRICPADPAGSERLKEGGTSYTLNSFIFNSGGFDANGNRLPSFDNVLKIPRPSATILAFIVAEQKRGQAADHTHSETWTNWAALLVDIEPDRHRAGNRAGDRLHGSANYLYADGHVENIAAAKVKSLIESGENIARPPEAP